MNAEDRDRVTDRLLDAALARYSEVEPRGGLEGRILAKLDEHSAQRALVWKRLFWVPVGCAAVLAIVAVVSLLHQTKLPVVHIASPVPAQVAFEKPPVKNSRPAQHVKRPAGHSISSVIALARSPRRAQFPSPSPISEQERLLIQYAQAAPVAEQLAMAQRQQQNRDVDHRGTPEDLHRLDINQVEIAPYERGSEPPVDHNTK